MRKWLQALVDEYLPAVADLQGTPEGQAQSLQWATWMRQQWAEHATGCGFPQQGEFV